MLDAVNDLNLEENVSAGKCIYHGTMGGSGGVLRLR